MASRKAFNNSLWSLCSWYGFTFLPVSDVGNPNKCKRFVGFLFISCTGFMAIYIPFLVLWQNGDTRNVLELLPYFLAGVAYLCFWISIKRMERKLQNSLGHLKTYSYPRENDGIVSKSVIHLLMVTAFMVCFAVHLANVYFEATLLPESYKSDIAYSVLQTCLFLMYYIVNFYVPTAFAVVYNSVCSQMQLVLSDIDSKLVGTLQKDAISSCLVSRYVEEHSKFVLLMLKVNEEFSPPMFFVIVMFLVKMFTVLATVLIQRSLTSYCWLWEDIVMSIVTVIPVFYAVCDKASGITITMENIASHFSQIHEEFLKQRYADIYFMSLLQCAKSRNPVTMSAGRVFKFSRSFFGVAVGTIVTYGLLLIQIEAIF